MIPNTIAEQLTLRSHKRLPLSSGSKMSLIDIFAEIPFIQAYQSPKARLNEPTTIRKIPEKAIDFLFIMYLSSCLILCVVPLHASMDKRC